MPMPGRNMVGDYRYAFQGQEKDSETGKEAFELRLWDSRIGRWLGPDPYGEFSSPYLGMGNNPISLTDPDGGMTEGCCPDPIQLEGFTGTQYTNKPVNFENRIGLYGIVGAQHLLNPEQYNNWDSSFKGNLADYNQQQGTNYGTKREAMAGYNYHFNYAVPQLDHIQSIHEATADAALLMAEGVTWVVPVGKIVPLGRFVASGSRHILGRYFIHTSKLHPRLYSYAAKGNGFGIGQFDAGHRATSFLRNEILTTGRIGAKNLFSRNNATIYFNKSIGSQNFSIGINPYKKSIFHEGPGIFR